MQSGQMRAVSTVYDVGLRAFATGVCVYYCVPWYAHYMFNVVESARVQ